MHNRTKIGILFLIFAAAVPALAQETREKKVAPPKKINYDERTLLYNPAWQDKETFLEADLDADPENEIIISFVASYIEKEEKKPEDKKSSFGEPPRRYEPAFQQNYAFFQIYNKGADGSFHAVKTFSGMDQMGTAEILALSADEPPGLALFSPGGETYVDLAIYQWREGGYRLIFNKGSSHGIEIKAQEQPVRIRIGKRDKKTESPLAWEEYVWDPGTRRFKPAPGAKEQLTMKNEE